MARATQSKKVGYKAAGLCCGECGTFDLYHDNVYRYSKTQREEASRREMFRHVLDDHGSIGVEKKGLTLPQQLFFIVLLPVNMTGVGSFSAIAPSFQHMMCNGVYGTFADAQEHYQFCLPTDIR